MVDLDNISDVLSGKRLPKGHNFISNKALGIPYITVSDMGRKFVSRDNIKYISEETEIMISKYKVKTNDIIISVAGTLGKINIIDSTLENANLTENCDKITNFNGVDINFLYHYLTSPSIEKQISAVNTVSSQPKLALERIRKFKISLPCITEQKKLGVFFDFMDNKIQLQQEKIDFLKEQKKGYMQKILNQEIRFKDANGSDYPKWLNNVKAERLFESVSNKNHNGDYPVLSATQDNGMVLRDSLERHMAFNDDNLKSYKLVEKNDFIISLRSFQGGIEFSNLQGLVSPAYTVFKSKSELVYDLYFAKLFKTENFISRLNSTTYGIRDGKAISYKDFSTLRFNIPSIEEQKKIAEFLDLLDLKILNENKKLEQLQNQKQAFMQQMFI